MTATSDVERHDEHEGRRPPGWSPFGHRPQPPRQLDALAPHADADAHALLAELLAAGHEAGTVRADLDVPELKAILVGCQAIGAYGGEVAARATAVVTDGLRPRRPS